MPSKIEGPLALRVNVWQPEDRVFTSPYMSNFVWPGNHKLVIAECSKGCPIDPQNPQLRLIQPDCTCGIYSSHDSEVIKQYIRNRFAVWTIIEGWGSEPLMYTDGMRSAAAEVIALVNMQDYMETNLIIKPGKMTFSGQNKALMAAIDYFNVPVLSYAEAHKLIKYYWVERHGGTWKEYFLK